MQCNYTKSYKLPTVQAGTTEVQRKYKHQLTSVSNIWTNSSSVNQENIKCAPKTTDRLVYNTRSETKQ